MSQMVSGLLLGDMHKKTWADQLDPCARDTNTEFL